MAKTSNLFKCPHCDYSTPRKYNLTLHLNKKKPCKPKETESINIPSQCSVNVSDKMVNDFEPTVNDFEPTVNDLKPTVNVFEKSVNERKYVCEICNKAFKSKQGKHQHKKNVKCKPPSQPVQESNLKTVERMQEEIDKLKSALAQQKEGPQVINNYITNNNDNSINNTNNNIINYNNFDSPNVDHITKEMIGEMYLKADRELPRMIGNAVRKIYKGLPENDTIKFQYGNKAGFAEVRQDDETRILPVSDVLETVLSQASTLCGKELRKCCGPHMIPGPNVVNHAEELSVLHWGFVPETHAKRQGYFKFVKSALL